MPSDVTQAREHLLAALEADLVGPYEKPGDLDVSDDLLKLPPSRWYLTGFLAPMQARELPEPTDDEIGAGWLLPTWGRSRKRSASIRTTSLSPERSATAATKVLLWET